MQNIPQHLINEALDEFARVLGYDHRSELPNNLAPADAATVTGAKPSTLSVWRCTGRRDVPYIRIGRLIRYPTRPLAEYLVRSTIHRTAA